MGRLSSLLPSRADLETGLQAALRQTAGGSVVVEILQRKTNDYASTHPSEIVACRIDGSARTFLVKYGVRRESGFYTGRGGVGYEASVYHHVLRPVRVGTVPVAGMLEDDVAGRTWLVLEYLPGCLRLDDSDGGIVAASRWLGRFHGEAAAVLPSETLAFLNRYDTDYYTHWARGAARRITPLCDTHPWLSGPIDRFEEWATALAACAHSVIHGEFYPHNILVRDDGVFPIDWESAAIGFAEIDLVSLTDGWNKQTVTDCRTAYVEERWGGSAPPDFETCLVYADIYWNFRWLSGLGRNRQPFNPDSTPVLPPRVKRLKAHYDRLVSQ